MSKCAFSLAFHVSDFLLSDFVSVVLCISVAKSFYFSFFLREKCIKKQILWVYFYLFLHFSLDCPFLFFCLDVFLCPSVYLCVCMSVCLSTCVSLSLCLPLTRDSFLCLDVSCLLSGPQALCFVTQDGNGSKV